MGESNRITPCTTWVMLSMALWIWMSFTVWQVAVCLIWPAKSLSHCACCGMHEKTSQKMAVAM